MKTHRGTSCCDFRSDPIELRQDLAPRLRDMGLEVWVGSYDLPLQLGEARGQGAKLWCGSRRVVGHGEMYVVLVIVRFGELE